MTKILAALIAATFSLGAFAQTAMPVAKSDVPAMSAATSTKKATKSNKSTKASKSKSAKKSKPAA
jgi:hypothetical protein